MSRIIEILTRYLYESFAEKEKKRNDVVLVFSVLAILFVTFFLRIQCFATSISVQVTEIQNQPVDVSLKIKLDK